jgi:hypothetical protein
MAELYGVFVLQQLWNWFAAPALHVAEFGYWQMLGFRVLIWMFFNLTNGSRKFDQQRQWKSAYFLLYASVRPEHRAEVDEVFKKFDATATKTSEEKQFFVAMLLADTVVLGFGWIIDSLI